MPIILSGISSEFELNMKYFPPISMSRHFLSILHVNPLKGILCLVRIRVYIEMFCRRNVYLTKHGQSQNTFGSALLR